ncbi:HU family DNA-binding protein [Clostridium beijerinckii]|uniref:HU family DNA-binding protein n=1 Tax=Clostridium beijerinckii TaxID=1520 RepID=UPI0015711F26|nr:HU family DNA-binding protein [Clostridium beijerinckii]NRU52541.1 nucleoid DNA-binding protein [Clostridium beijerinckii]NYC69282.1 nucleoid DNA-binding protein [Clostridium beijerinckii]NYC91742.1 nucleoid DNA-binding protein [Clostridium beijerinckii]
MNKAELVKAFAEKIGVSVKEAGEKLQVLNDLIFDALKEGKDVTLLDLGKIKIVETAEREGLKKPGHPEEGKKLYPASKKAKYSASKSVKEAVK